MPSIYPATTPVLPADASTNVAVPPVGARLLLWNGTSWDPADSINTGQQKITLYDSSGSEIVFGSTVGETITANADAVSNTKNQDRTVTRVEKFDPINNTWFRGDAGLVEGTLRASSAAVAGYNLADQTNYGYKGVLLYLNVTAVSGSGSPTLTLTISAKDPASGVYATLLTVTGVTATGMYKYAIYPAALAGLESGQNAYLPKTWRVAASITGTTPSFTHSIGYCLLP